MMRCALILSALLGSAAAAVAQSKDFTVRWHGQSFFTVTAPSGKVVAFDPHVMREFERKDPIKADFVCVSHPHNDHNRVEEAIADGKDEKKVKVFNGLKLDTKPVDPDRPKPADWNKIDEKVKVGDASYRFRNFPCYHDEMSGLKRGKNALFVVEIEGLTFCHAGDLGHTFTDAEIKIIGKIDVLFVPVGGNFTLNGETAKELADQLKPRLQIVPMHFAVDNQPDTLLAPDEFLDSFDEKQVQKLVDTNELIIAADAKAEKPTVTLLNWEKKKK